MRRTTRPLSSLPTTVPAVKWHKAQFFSRRRYRRLGENRRGTTAGPSSSLRFCRVTGTRYLREKPGKTMLAPPTSPREQDLNAVCSNVRGQMRDWSGWTSAYLVAPRARNIQFAPLILHHYLRCLRRCGIQHWEFVPSVLALLGFTEKMQLRHKEKKKKKRNLFSK